MGEQREQPTNDINLNIRGDVVYIDARLDFAGLAILERKLIALRAIMKPNDSEPDDGGRDA